MKLIVLPPNYIVVVALFSSSRKTKVLNGIKSIYEYLKQNYSVSETNSLRYLDVRRFCFLDILEVAIPKASTPASVSAEAGENNGSKKVAFLCLDKDDFSPLDNIEIADDSDIILFTNICIAEKDIKRFGDNIIPIDNSEELKSTIKSKL